ncbi:MAG TPA: hypothetical protein PK313_05980, partial [Myxococcota bacterium]|nr:hypothetical protein [Myxococcota bacterium]
MHCALSSHGASRSPASSSGRPQYPANPPGVHVRPFAQSLDDVHASPSTPVPAQAQNPNEPGIEDHGT